LKLQSRIGKSVKLFSSLQQHALGWQNFIRRDRLAFVLSFKQVGGAGFRLIYWE